LHGFKNENNESFQNRKFFYFFNNFDCRAYIEDPEDINSKSLKCGYNPYTGEWSEWSTNPLKQKAIEHYGRKEIIKK